MKKYFFGIFMVFSLLLSLSIIQGNGVQKWQPQEDIYLLSAEESSIEPETLQNNKLLTDILFSLNIPKICEVPVSVFFSIRGGNHLKSLKFSSAIRALSTQRFIESIAGNNYKHWRSDFIKTSYRYYIYTLRRLLI